MINNRFDRQLPLFGEKGQAKLRAATVAIVGAGGTGSIVIPQLAMLGVGHLIIIDHDELEETNRNRHWCARCADSIPGTLKVEAVKRSVLEYDPSITVETVRTSLLTEEGFAAVKRSDYVFGCVDLEGVRLVLTELCAAYANPYIDVSSGVQPGEPLMYGGRVLCAVGGEGCLVCMDELDIEEAARDLESVGQRKDRDAIYGVASEFLDRRGPSVVSVNAVVSSIAVTEFMKLCTGLDAPTRLVKYDGRASRVTVNQDAPRADCYYCKGIWNAGLDAGVDRYLKSNETAFYSDV